MFNRVAESLKSLFFSADKKNNKIRIVIFSAIVAPVVLVGAFAYFESYQDMTESALARRQSVAKLAAAVLEQRFQRLTDIGTSLATRVRFRQLVSADKWDEAVEILKTVQKDFPIIDRIFLTDPSGTLKADTPSLPGVKGKNFAYRDWYRGVNSKWKPYISEVYLRAAEPRYNVIAVGVPIMAEKEKPVGILVLQVRLDVLVDWSKSVGVGFSGFVYFVDKKGGLAAHPKISFQNKIVDYSRVPVVQKVLRGESGVDLSFNPIENEEQVAAYAPVPVIGWGVIATEPTQSAFATRNKDLNEILLRYGFLFLISSIVAYIILRVLAERELVEAERLKVANLLNSVIENNPVMIFLKEAKDLRFVMFNQAAEKISGYTRENFIGKNDYDLFSLQDADRSTAKDREVLARRDVLEILEERIQTKHHGERILRTRKTALFDPKGEPQYLLGVSEDITERKEAEEAVRQLNIDLQKQSAQLQAANTELEAFSYSVSHDLRAPLRSIEGFSQALLEDYVEKLDEEGKDYLQRVRASTQRMGELIDDMLNMSRITRSDMHREPVDLTEMAQASAAELRNSAPDRDVEFVIADGLTAQGDARLLRIVMDNLLGNAWKYTSKHPRACIEFGYAQNSDQSTYFVRDDGAGFDMTYADKLFGVFQRLHRQTEFPGTGVGLATVQRIMHRHGGQVWAEAQVDKGATFYFTLSN